MAGRPDPKVSESGHQDANQNFSVIGVQGTLGTSDIAGTAPTVAIGANPLTGAMYVQDLSGQSGTTNIAGTVQVSAGTVVGTFLEVTGSATAGTTDLIAAMDVSNYKYLGLQSIGTFVGTVNIQISNDNINFSNLNFSAISTTSNAPSVAITSNNIYYAPIFSRYMRVRANAFTSGTVSAVLELYSIPPPHYQMGVSAGQAGAWNVTGTIATGTIAAGTFQRSSIPVQLGTPLVTVGTTGAAVWGTLVAASGAGTKQYVARTSIVVQSGTVDVAVTNIGIGGSIGAGVLERGQFVQGGGITNNYDPAMVSGTNGTLSYWLGGAGTVAITVNYWQGV